LTLHFRARPLLVLATDFQVISTTHNRIALDPSWRPDMEVVWLFAQSEKFTDWSDGSWKSCFPLSPYPA